MRIVSYLEKQKDVWVALFLSFVFFLTRFPSLFEPNWYGDEGIYQAIGRALRVGKLLYVGAWDNKPPTLYYLYAFFDANQFQIRLFSLIIGVLTLLVFFYLCINILKSTKASILASSLFIFLFGTPILEGNIANAENFMLFPAISAVLIVYLNRQSFLEKIPLDLPHWKQIIWKTKESRLLFFTGFLLGISFTIKILALFDLATICTILLFFIVPTQKQVATTHWKKTLNHLFSLIIPIITGFIIPMLLYTIYFLIKGEISLFLGSAFLGNINYVGYQNDFIIPQGLLVLRTIILVFSLGLLFFNRKALLFEAQLLCIWLLFSLYSTFFSNRPYPHYLLLLIPVVCLIFGYAITKNRKSVLAFVGSFVIFLFFYFQTTWTKNPFTYYPNFISFITNHKSTEEYQTYFDKNVPRDYAVAEYIRTVVKPNEDIFIWGNSAQIYVLANKIPPIKYTVAYHIAYNKKTFDETNVLLQKINPAFIVILPDEKEKPFSLTKYRYMITIKDSAIYERIY